MNVRYANPIACAMLRIDARDLLKPLPYARIVDPLLKPIAEKLATALSDGENFSREYRVFLPGGVRCVQCDFMVLRQIRGKRMFALYLADTTEEDEVRQKLSAQLEETHRYARLKENFFANMSHEIRTPINAILGMTYFLKAREKDERCRDYIGKIENASELLLRVVNDILDFSKMNEHKFSLKPENFNLRSLKKVLVDLFSEKAEKKGIELHVEFDCPEPFYVHGDQFRLTQVFMNLINNAIKFTDRGFVSVSANVETIGTEAILRCSVRDSGCGISEENLSKLFTEFEQFDEVLRKQTEGSGLGLAICKRLVELMQGVIWVDSSPDHGSSFHFVVVLSVAEPEAGPADSAGGNASGSLPRISRNSGVVLLAEDNEINTEIAKALIAEEGYSVECAADGKAAIEMCRTRPVNYYDLILMDIHMPVMNGYDAAKVLKEELRIGAPIIAVTGTEDDSDGDSSYRGAFAAFIRKPYDPAAFRELFSKA